MKTFAKISMGVAVIATIVLASGIWWWRQPEQTPALRGRQVAERLGCMGCHGAGGQGGVADPTAPSGEMPGWRYATAKVFIQSEDDIRQWILNGSPEREERRKYHGEHQALIPMPAYREYLSDTELDDLVAYFLAVSGWAAEIPDEAYEGRRIASRLGCFGCHGPSGMGGVNNPGAFKGHIPPWDGDEFEELVRDEDELREWILYGKIERLTQNRAARFFLDRQKTPMPAYHDYISDAELDLLVHYIQWLREEANDAGTKQRDAATVIATIHGGR